VDDRNERMNQKIREAQLQKIPYMLVVGNREMETNAVSVRLRTGEQLPSMPLAEFKAKVAKLISSRSLELKL
jgi:threonyl-tRNA synthetase